MRALSFLTAFLLLAAAGYIGLREAPDRYNPVAPLHINDKPSLLTGWKLKELRGDPESCFAMLEDAGIEYAALSDSVTGPGCGFEDAAMLQGSSVSWGRELPMTCPLLAATMIWERHDLQPLAERYLGQKVTRVRHFGTYACRNINGAQAGARSEHAEANAIDVAGFVLADGREVSVLDHWRTKDAEGDFLHALRDHACGRFATVLSPDYNKAHANHFHFDMGRHDACR